MKFILAFFVLIMSFSVFPSLTLTAKNLKCSRSGTDVTFVNGISYSLTDVIAILTDEIKPAIPGSFLDNKAPADLFVRFSYSYNHTNGFLRDLLESSAQKISQNFNISSDDAFVAAYYFTYKEALTAQFIESIFKLKSVSLSSIFNFVTSFFNPNLLDKMIHDSIIQNTSDNINLKSSISSTLLSGKKLIIISESQGNFFINSVIRDFQNGQLLSNGTKTGKYEDFKDYVGQVQISPPTRSIISKNRVVLNDKDVINLIFFDKPEPTFNYFEVPDNDPRGIVDHIANHMITSTYLNDYEVATGSLPALREFTLQSVVNVASLLESNCPKAVINYTKSNLAVNFDSTGNTDITGLTYSWNFGDNQVSTLKNPSHNYSVAGTYNVSLTVTDAYGASDTAQASVTVQSDAAVITFCNVGNFTSDMNFTVNNYETFSLHHRGSAGETGNPFEYNDCECKKLTVSRGEILNIYVDGVVAPIPGLNNQTVIPYSQNISVYSDYLDGFAFFAIPDPSDKDSIIFPITPYYNSRLCPNPVYK